MNSARACLLSILLTAVAGAQGDSGPQALARQLARAADLFTTYQGRWPASLEELTRKPADARFWPDSGFWLGTLPPAAQLKDGVVTFGGASERLKSPTWSPVVPPSDRLKQFFSARVALALLRSAAEYHLDSKGTLPKAAADLGPVPTDPWGKPYATQFLKNRVRLSVDGAAARQDVLEKLTPEESKALEEAGRPRVDDALRATIVSLLGKFRDDDFEPREQALARLEKIGAVVQPFLAEAIKAEKDPDVRGRLARIAPRFPKVEPSWRTELRPLSAIVLAQRSRALDTSCMNNLSQLWKMQNIYMSQFGGRMKSMPLETGKDFWLKLEKTVPPLIDVTEREMFICPVSGLESKPGVCSYAGPAEKVARIAGNGVVGMCDDEGHGDEIILLRKSGDVLSVPREGPEHTEATKGTKR